MNLIQLVVPAAVEDGRSSHTAGVFSRFFFQIYHGKSRPDELLLHHQGNLKIKTYDKFAQVCINQKRSLAMFSGQSAPSPAQIAIAQAEARRTMKGFVYTIITIRAIPFVFNYIGRWFA
ncbi:hypothetical protein O181_023207 [Austropuccinia psidii MF-1]|uniref:Uncharacterized protein n=1 Tax=Austropuccinia psidii MF-1 TaxID=1389203 RepID=A0A9Q3GXU2_9BASI|nr:hypothetical protein [Austropuccinia psidii MF-1]